MKQRHLIQLNKDANNVSKTPISARNQTPKNLPSSYIASAILQESLKNPTSIKQTHVVQLQSIIGNREMGRLLYENKKQNSQNDFGLRLGNGDNIQKTPTANASTIAEPQNAGSELPPSVRAKMENAFHSDFSSVRVRTGPQANAIDAAAYTQGTNIHFAPGHYSPFTLAGQRLLGHELAHVVQQRQGRVKATTQAKGLPVNDDRTLEHEADKIGNQIASGKTLTHPISSGNRMTMSTNSSSDQPIQCNKIVSSTAPQLDDPLDALYSAFKKQTQVFSLNGTPLDVRALPPPISAIHPKPKRVTKLTAVLDGKRNGGARSADSTQTAYGHLGEYERTIFGRRITSSPTYAGGHLVADEILGTDSYVQENFAPQHVYLNSPAYRVIEEMAEAGPTNTAGNRAPNWTMEVELTYDPNYSRTVDELKSVGVIDGNITQTDSGQSTVSFPRRVPHIWKVKLTAPSGFVFPQKQVSGNRQLDMLHGTVTQTESQKTLTRTTSNLALWGMGSLVKLGAAPNTSKHVAGNQIEEFVGIQSQPEPEATQPTYNPTNFGLPPQPVVKPGVSPQILKHDIEMMDIFQDSTEKRADTDGSSFKLFITDTGLPPSFGKSLGHVIHTDLYNNNEITKTKAQLLKDALTHFKKNSGINKRPSKKGKNQSKTVNIQAIVNKLILDGKLKLTKVKMPSTTKQMDESDG